MQNGGFFTLSLWHERDKDAMGEGVKEAPSSLIRYGEDFEETAQTQSFILLLGANTSHALSVRLGGYLLYMNHMNHTLKKPHGAMNKCVHK